jgi:hypothetical protein
VHPAVFGIDAMRHPERHRVSSEPVESSAQRGQAPGTLRRWSLRNPPLHGNPAWWSPLGRLTSALRGAAGLSCQQMAQDPGVGSIGFAYRDWAWVSQEGTVRVS